MSEARGQRSPSALWPFRSSYYGWAIATTALVTSFASVPMYGPVLSIWFKPIQDEMGWSSAEISASFTVGSFLGSILTAVVGRVLDKAGARVVAAVGGMILAAAMLGLALMQAPWQMWLFFGAGRGFALAGVQLGSTVAIANWFVHKRGRAISLAGFGQRFGQAIVPVAMVPVIIGFGWREAYGVTAVGAVLLITVPALLFYRRRPEDYGLLPDGAQPGEDASSGGSRSAARVITDQAWSVAQARRTVAFWLMLLTTSTIFLAQTATNLHAAPHFQERGVAFESTAIMVFVFAMTSALMTFPWGWVLDRVHVRWVIVMVSGVYLLSMVIIIIAESFWGAVAFGVTFGVAQGGWTVSQRVVVPNYFGRQSMGAIRGFMGLITAFINPIGPVLAGVIRDVSGDYQLAFLIFGGAFLAAMVMMALAAPPRHPSDPRA